MMERSTTVGVESVCCCVVVEMLLRCCLAFFSNFRALIWPVLCPKIHCIPSELFLL